LADRHQFSSDFFYVLENDFEKNLTFVLEIFIKGGFIKLGLAGNFIHGG